MRDRQGIVRLNHNKKNELQIYTMFRVRQSHIDFYSKRQRVVVLGTRNPSSTVRCSSMAIRVVGLYYEIESFESMLAMWYSRTIGENRHTTIIQSLHVCWSHCMYNDQSHTKAMCCWVVSTLNLVMIFQQRPDQNTGLLICVSGARSR